VKENTFTADFQIFENNLWGGHLQVPDQWATQHIRGNNRRIICRLREELEINAALMPSKSGWYILINKEIQKKLGLKPGMRLQITLRNDDSEYGMPMPEELEWILLDDEEAHTHFEALTPGKKRNLIYLVLSVKNRDSRIKKALAICDHLKQAKGKLDFKALNEVIKYYNQQNKLGFD
jgi:hypothetical protein